MKNNKIILLVEDVIEIGIRLEQKISKLFDAFSIHRVTLLEEAFLFLKHTNPDIIILDLKLPDGSGIKILKKVKKKNSNILIFVFSISSELKNICLRHGANDFFDKKEGSERLLEVLGNL